MWRGLISSLRWCYSTQLRLKANHRHCSRPSCSTAVLMFHWKREGNGKRERAVNRKKIKCRRCRRKERIVSLSITPKTKMLRLHGITIKKGEVWHPDGRHRIDTRLKRQKANCLAFIKRSRFDFKPNTSLYSFLPSSFPSRQTDSQIQSYILLAAVLSTNL